jgi:hypothetical protein
MKRVTCVFWNVIPCILVNKYRRFGAISFFHFQCRNAFFYSVLFCSDYGEHTFARNVCTGVHSVHSRGCSVIFVVATARISNLASRTGDKFWRSEFMWWSVDQVHDSEFSCKTHHRNNNLLGRQVLFVGSVTWLLMQAHTWFWHIVLSTPLQFSLFSHLLPIAVMRV